MTSAPTELNSRQAADAAVEAAYARHAAGDDNYARQIYTQVLRRFPRHARALCNLGVVEIAAGRPREAFQLIAKSISIDPTDPNAHYHIGHLFLRAGEKTKARQAFSAAAAAGPEHLESLSSLAKILAVDGDMNAAAPLIEKIIGLAPDKSARCIEFAELMAALDRHDHAASLLTRATEFDPGDAQAHNNLGVCCDRLGRHELAIKHYERAIEINPSHARSMASLISLPAYRPSNEFLQRAYQLAQREDIEPDAAAKLLVALGKYSDRHGDFAEAFDHFLKANAHVRKSKSVFNARAFEAFIDVLIAAFEAGRLRDGPSRPADGVTPVFIVGMPRSGTSLVEQIIASHPKAHGAGELQDIPNIVSSLGSGYPGSFQSLPGAALEEFSRRYLDKLESLSPPGASHVTDKLPLNFMHLGVLAALFPHARVIHCRRDPLDVGLSCFIERFDMPQDFSTTFEDFALFYRGYLRLMEHWRSVAPLPIYELEYERLVRDQENETRKMISFCGLKWSADCLNFTKTERAVSTPSRWQVRQPLYQSSIGRWRNYETQLAPLIRLLGE